jgi:hypothetical protein
MTRRRKQNVRTMSRADPSRCQNAFENLSICHKTETRRCTQIFSTRRTFNGDFPSSTVPSSGHNFQSRNATFRNQNCCSSLLHESDVESVLRRSYQLSFSAMDGARCVCELGWSEKGKRVNITKNFFQPRGRCRSSIFHEACCRHCQAQSDKPPSFDKAEDKSCSGHAKPARCLSLTCKNPQSKALVRVNATGTSARILFSLSIRAHIRPSLSAVENTSAEALHEYL